MVKKAVHKTEKVASKDDSDSKLFAFLGVFLSVIGYIIVMLARKEDKYAMYYAKQGLVLFIAWVIAWVAAIVLGWIPVVGWLVSTGVWVLIVVFWVIGIIYALSGEEKEIPIIGQFAKKI